MSSSIYSRRRSSGRVRRISRKVLILLFSTALVTTGGIILLLGLQLRVYSNQNQLLSDRMEKQNREVRELQSKIAEMNTEIASLVGSKFPHLTPLSFDQVLSVKREYVKNIVFTVAGRNGHKQHEYKVVFENHSNGSVTPEVTIVFFDRVGLQVGVSEIKLDGSGNILESGEIKSYSGKIGLSEGVQPEYFMVRIGT